MILTRTPFRVTLGGGGTDLPSFYEKHGGYILATGIDKYMYIALNVPEADRPSRQALLHEPLPGFHCGEARDARPQAYCHALASP